MTRITYTIAFFALVFAGCDTVVVNAPFGNVTAEETVQSLGGTWTDGHGNVYHAEPDGKGGIVMGAMRWSENKGQFLAVNTPMSTRTVDGRVLLFLPGDEGATDRFLFLWLTKIGENEIWGRYPKPEVFRQLVIDGSLTGHIIPMKNDHFEVSVTADDKLVEAISGDHAEQLFEPEQGKPLRRIKGTKSR